MSDRELVGHDSGWPLAKIGGLSYSRWDGRAAPATRERPFAWWRDGRWWVLLCAALLLRVWSVAALASDPRVAEPILDGKYYLELAERLASGQGWPPGPIFMTPFYPWVLGLLFRLAAAVPLPVQILQAGLGLVTFVLLTATARRDLGERTSLALGALYVLCGPLLGIESQVLTESLLLFLTSAALFLWPKPGQPWWRPGLFGVVAGLLATCPSPPGHPCGHQAMHPQKPPGSELPWHVQPGHMRPSFVVRMATWRGTAVL